MFRRIIEGLQQNLSIICEHSIYVIAISENISKYDISDSKEDTYRGVPLQQIWMLQANNFSKKNSTTDFFWSLAHFCQNRRKEQLFVNSSEKYEVKKSSR